jgi:hypothetical protein
MRGRRMRHGIDTRNFLKNGFSERIVGDLQKRSLLLLLIGIIDSWAERTHGVE